MTAKKTPPKPPRQKPTSKKEGEQPKRGKAKQQFDDAMDKLKEAAVDEIKSRGNDKKPKEKLKPTGVKLTPEQEAEKFQQVLNIIAEDGLSVKKATAICNISSSTFYRHMDINYLKGEFTELTEEEIQLMGEERQKRYARACEARHKILLEETLEIADETDNDWKTLDNGAVIPDREVVARSKLRVDTRLKYLEMVEPTKYGKKVETTLIGKEGAPPVQINLGSGIAPPDEQQKTEQP